MKKIDFQLIINNIFRIFLIFIIVYIWTFDLINNQVSRLIVCFLSAFIINGTLYLLLKNKYKKLNLDKKTKSEIQKISDTFSVMSDSEIKAYLININPCLKRKKFCRHLIHCDDENSYVIQLLNCKSTSKQNLLDIIIQLYWSFPGLKQITIYLNQISPSDKLVIESINNFKVNIVEIESLYFSFIKPSNILPEARLKFNKVYDKKLKNIMPRILSKTKIKGYLFSAFILLLSSIIVPYKIYYLASASVLILLCLISLFVPNKQSL